MKTKYIILAFICLFSSVSCNDLFDDFSKSTLPEDKIWTDPQLLDEYVLPWYRNMSHGFSVYMPTSIFLRGLGREYMPWYGDQLTVSKSDWYSTAYGEILKSSPKEIQRRGGNLWQKYYEQIRSINNLLEHEGSISSGQQKNRVLGEAHFFRAYYHYLLLRQFGGVIIAKEVYDPLKGVKKFPRASYDEMVQFITDEATLANEYLSEFKYPNNSRYVTPGAALMLKAKAYLWVAGDHFQNTEKEYLGFATNKSAEMIQHAKEAYDELMKLNYQLLEVSGANQDAIAKSYRQIFLTKNSKESIFEVQHSDDGNFDVGFGHKLDAEAVTSYEGGTTAAYTPTQNHVDEYGMQQGKTFDAQNPYANRDFRFYANVLYDGCMFRGHIMEIHYSIEDGKEVAGADLRPSGTAKTAAVTQTGYYLGKFVNEKQAIDNHPSKGSNQNFIIWRFAEVLLDYAEIDFKQGRPNDALKKINKIRARAHMHDLESITWEAIMNERRVELAFEESTYWDLLRYNIAEEKMNGSTNPLKVMKVIKEEGKPTVYQISNMNKKPENVRTFMSKQYYYPIHWDEIRYQEFDQNPEWEEL